MYVFLFLYVHCKITYTCTRKWLSIYCTITIEHADCRYLMKHETTHTGERFKAAKCRYCGKTVNNNNIFYVFYFIWCSFLFIWQSSFRLNIASWRIMSWFTPEKSHSSVLTAITGFFYLFLRFAKKVFPAIQLNAPNMIFFQTGVNSVS